MENTKMNELQNMISRIAKECHEHNKPTESMFVAMLVGAYELGVQEGEQGQGVSTRTLLSCSL